MCVVQTNVYGVFKKKGMWIQGIILLHVFIVGKSGLVFSSCKQNNHMDIPAYNKLIKVKYS